MLAVYWMRWLHRWWRLEAGRGIHKAMASKAAWIGLQWVLCTSKDWFSLDGQYSWNRCFRLKLARSISHWLKGDLCWGKHWRLPLLNSLKNASGFSEKLNLLISAHSEWPTWKNPAANEGGNSWSACLFQVSDSKTTKDIRSEWQPST